MDKWMIFAIALFLGFVVFCLELWLVSKYKSFKRSRKSLAEEKDWKVKAVLFKEKRINGARGKDWDRGVYIPKYISVYKYNIDDKEYKIKFKSKNAGETEKVLYYDLEKGNKVFRNDKTNWLIKIVSLSPIITYIVVILVLNLIFS